MEIRMDYSRQYYLKNRERLLARKKERYLQNREKELARYRAWYEFNIEYKREYDKQRAIKKKEQEAKKFVVRFDD